MRNAEEGRRGDTMAMADDVLSRELSNKEFLRVYLQESLIFDVTERICEAMKEQNVSRSELARRLNKTKGYVTQVLKGTANLTLRTVSDILFALNRTMDVSLAPVEL